MSQLLQFIKGLLLDLKWVGKNKKFNEMHYTVN